MTSRIEDAEQKQPSWLARLFGSLAKDVGQETGYALRDIRSTHETLWFGRAVTPSEPTFSQPENSYQENRFAELYGSPSAKTSEPSIEASTDPSRSVHPRQQVRFDELYGQDAPGSKSEPQRETADRSIER